MNEKFNDSILSSCLQNGWPDSFLVAQKEASVRDARAAERPR